MQIQMPRVIQRPSPNYTPSPSHGDAARNSPGDVVAHLTASNYPHGSVADLQWRLNKAGAFPRACVAASITLACVFAVESARAAGAPSRCADISVPKGAIEARGGKWIELTSDQWQFLRGVFVLNPITPPGLPFGERAALAQVGGDQGGIVFFVDGERACDGMAIPAVLLEMMRAVGAGDIKHEAGGL